MKPYKKTAGLLDAGISGHLPVTKTPVSCMGCRFRQMVGSNPNDTACLYLFITGKRRGCPVEDCDKYEKKKTAALSPQKRNGQRKKNITIKSISQPAGKSQQNAWRERYREEAQAASERERAKAGRANPAGSPADFIQSGSPQSREALKGKLRAYQKAYYAANKERIAERQRAYRAAHKEKARAYQKAYYAAHREKELARQKAYRGRQGQ